MQRQNKQTEFNTPSSYGTQNKSIYVINQSEGPIFSNIKINQFNNDNSIQKDKIIFHPKISNIINKKENNKIYQEEFKIRPIYNQNYQEFPQIKNNLNYITIESQLNIILTIAKIMILIYIL